MQKICSRGRGNRRPIIVRVIDSAAATTPIAIFHGIDSRSDRASASFPAAAPARPVTTLTRGQNCGPVFFSFSLQCDALIEYGLHFLEQRVDGNRREKSQEQQNQRKSNIYPHEDNRTDQMYKALGILLVSPITLLI